MKFKLIYFVFVAVFVLFIGCGISKEEEGIIVSTTTVQYETVVITKEISTELETTSNTSSTTSTDITTENTNFYELSNTNITTTNTEMNFTTLSSSTLATVGEDLMDNIITTESNNETKMLETTEATTTFPKKTIEEIAREVWSGKWGCDEERKNLLTSAGYDYLEIQKEVEKLKDEYSSTNEDVGSKVFVKTFSRGTYYAYGGPRKGGSGRQLIDCSQGDGSIKGSIASSYLYKMYGYNYNNSRTKVYLEISGYSTMNGWYYLDDSDAGNPNVIDFFYINGSNCPFKNQGVVIVNCYI